ncbi:MAG: pilus assembly protein N-terminal domain-containing protein [Pirellulales bacterium]|nr:pilus assembly protein N-terminal domain-containing protein [Pirellulales bacterium]
MVRSILLRVLPLGMMLCFCASAAWSDPPAGPDAVGANPPLLFEVKLPRQRLQMTVDTSRILELGQKIPQMEVSNPALLDLTPLSPTQVQVSAKAKGVTQINLWGEDQKIYTIDVMIHNDAREMTMLLQSQFPTASLKVIPFADTVLISGYVEQAEHIKKIMEIAKAFYPNPMDNIRVGGVQQVLLHVKVMEVSRTKLRRLGFDWAQISGSNGFLSGPNSLLSDYDPTGLTIPPNLFRMATPSTFAFSVVSGNNAFFGVLDALRQDRLMKILSEPTLVTVNGRAAKFHVGGQIAIQVPQSLGTVSIEFKNYGTDIDFVPIVLGNGNISLEIRPVVSELDYANGTTIGGTTVPGLRDRKADTAVELMAGQTLAIAGLVQSRVEAENSGLPWVSDVPYLGAAFRKTRETVNEVEVLILVTPELVAPLDACQVPQCGPGLATTSPSDWELYMQGHVEVPNCCPTGDCGPCLDSRNGGPPPDGMIGPEPIPSPDPGASPHDARLRRRPAATVASNPNNRHSRARPQPLPYGTAPGGPNEPPGFIGPIGYDVIK